MFIFQTGHGKGLAKIEIESLLGKNSIIDEVKDGFLVDAEIKPELLKKMGSCVRIAKVLHSGPSRMPLNFKAWIVSSLKKQFQKNQKNRFGLSMHPKNERTLKKLLVETKKELKKEVGNLRFVNKDFQNLSSVQSWHESLLTEGAADLHLFEGEEKWHLSQSIAIQDFEWYSKRDIKRPAKSAKNGMLPPKLAQTLINLALPQITEENRESITIFDPFCGSGTLIQEALLMGHPALGCDLIEDRTKESQKNLDWLIKQEEFNKSTQEKPSLKLFTKDATKLTEQDLPASPFVIVTETWLGPALEKALTDLERPKVQREIETLYESFFSNLKSILKKDQSIKMVFTAPYHRGGNERHFLPRLPEILEKHCKIIPLSEHKRPSLFYERKGQFVSREIWKLEISKSA